MNLAIVIPARFASSRLPGKPLIKIDGIPMIQRTYERCAISFCKKKIFVLTDSLKIKKFCKSKNIKCALTSSKCLTGTDRVAEFSLKNKFTHYLNVQGDEPCFNPDDIYKLINFAKKNPNHIINGYTKINCINDYYNPNIPKVAFDENNNLLYMSRAPIPSSKKKKFNTSYKQVCAYIYPKKKLLQFIKKKTKTKFENFEDIEILRFLEIGIKVKMIELSNESISVDIKSDLNKVKRRLRNLKISDTPK